MVVKLLRQKQK